MAALDTCMQCFLELVEYTYAGPGGWTSKETKWLMFGRVAGQLCERMCVNTRGCEHAPGARSLDCNAMPCCDI